MLVPDDSAIAAIAAALLLAAGALQYTVSVGERGLSAFLGQEKSSNKFYTDPTFVPERPSAPAWLESLRVLAPVPSAAQLRPDAFSRGDSKGNTRERLYARLDAAVECEDYELAAQIKAQLDVSADESADAQ